MGRDEIFHVITYPELYRYRGKELKMLNRLEYSALVKFVSGRDIYYYYPLHHS